MKKYAVLLILVLMIITLMSSCFHRHHDISISLSDDRDMYEMEADYRKSKSRDVEIYLNNHLLKRGHINVDNDLNDKEITLNEKTNFYIRSKPGTLHIKIDKTINSEKSRERVKLACEELKDILADN